MTRLTSRLIWAAWAAQLVLLVGFVHRYALLNPFVDEWEFIPVLYGEAPAGSWLWALHNEHRFPLPRVFYLASFWLTNDLRTLCYLNALILGAVSAWWIVLLQRQRGHASWVDIAVPSLLMQPAQDENVWMGYQICFLLVVVLSTCWVAVAMTPWRPLPKAVLAGFIGLALLTCGAAGLVYGSAAIGWMLFVSLRHVRGWRSWLPIILMAGCLPAYLFAYSQGYVRPAHHPPSAGILASARIALQAFGMAFGPASTGPWPWFSVGVLIVGLFAIMALARSTYDIDRRLGLFAIMLAGPAVAFGIGWGRSGFDGDMGFAWRYGLLMAPSVLAAGLALHGNDDRWARFLRWLVAGAVISTWPVNVATAFMFAERDLAPKQRAWRQDVEMGRSAEEIARQHFGDCDDDVQAQVARAVRLFRQHRYAYYDPGQGPP